MINLPDLAKLQVNTSYTDIFRDTFIWNIGIYGMGTFLIFLIFLLIKLYQIKKKEFKEHTRQSLLTNNRQSQQEQQAQNRESTVVIGDSTSNIVEEQQKKSNKITAFDFINRVTSVAFYLTLISIAAVFLGFYAFGELGHGTGHDVLAIFIMIAIVLLPTLIWKKKSLRRNQKISKEQLIFAGVMVFLWIGLSVFAVIALKGVCICVFNNKYGTKINKDFVFSTQFTRSMQIQKVCKDGQVCHIYTTLPENASDSVFINLHTGTNINNLTVTLTESNEQENSNRALTLVNKTPIKLHDIQHIAQRNIFSFYFQSLKSDTLYTIVVKNTDNDAILETKKYRTLPGQNAPQLRLAVGGDVGIDDQASLLTSYLKEFNPHVIILGGDNAYDDGMKTCFYSWDNLYDIMDELNSKLNRLVPLILSVGNHDVGFNAFAGVQIDMSETQNIPYYFLYNPQHKTLGSSQIPLPKDRRSYHYHILGPSVHVHLDSGYIEKYNTQGYFLQKIINNFPLHLKFANYHNPIYPSCTDSTEGSNDRLVIDQGLKNWTPLFDLGKFIAAFEHHTHHRKFTYKIKGDKVVNKTDVGVRYVGDGSWGVPEDPCPSGHETKRPQYFQYHEKQNANHVWKIRILNTQGNYSIEYTAIDGKNVTVFNTTDML